MIIPSKRYVFFFGLVAIIVLQCGCNRWTELGPPGSGRISGIVLSDANHLWVSSPGGGVWKTTDGGASWVWAGNFGLDDFTALDIVFDRVPSVGRRHRMFLRTWNGFWVSSDDGATWTRTLFSVGNGDTSYFQPFFACSIELNCLGKKTPDFEPRPMAQMVFSVSRPGPAGRIPIVLGSVVFTALPCNGLQFSIDRGNNFTQIWPFPGNQNNPDNCITSIAADEATGKVYFATMATADTRGSGSHIFRSTGPWTLAGPPSGLAWEAVNNGIPSQNPANALVWGGSADRLMALVIDGDGATTTPYLFDGITWTAKPFNDANCIFTTDARSLAWGGNNDFFAGGVTFAYTPTAGDTWVCPALNNQHVDIRAIAPVPNLRRVWIGGDQSSLGGGFVISSYPWTPGVALGDPTGIVGNGMSTWQAYSVAVGRAPQQPRIIVAAQDVIDACSDDGGANWTLLSNTQEGQSLAWLQNNGADVLYSYGILGTLQVAVNPGSAATCSDIHFVDISPPDSLRTTRTSTGPHLMAVNPSNTQQVFLANFRSVTYTLDGGGHWASSNFSPPGFSSSPAPSAIFVDENGVIYVGTQEAGAFICTDTVNFCNGSEGSGTWTAWGLNPGGNVNPVGGTSPRMITAIAESNPPNAGPRNFWMASTDGLYRQLSGETTWTLVAITPSGFGAPPYVYNEVVVDPTCRTRIYTGLGYLQNFSRSRGGIQISSDNGGNWTSLSSGFDLHNVPITELAIVPQEPQRVLASTYGRGAWEYDWHVGQPVPPGNANLPACAP